MLRNIINKTLLRIGTLMVCQSGNCHCDRENRALSYSGGGPDSFSSPIDVYLVLHQLLLCCKLGDD
jgi:hypothetical protein